MARLQIQARLAGSAKLSLGLVPYMPFIAENGVLAYSYVLFGVCTLYLHVL